ncbi:hypothetical protein BD779DRAFT_1785955 [Infundibulicybe gibba]|nr:hypothetical protein BD779DRAFT_1785955 [Infundibulicybe gibba]
MSSAPVASTSYLSSTMLAISNHFRPHRAEALQRIRTNAFCFLVILVVSNLLPLPSLQAALRNMFFTTQLERWSSDWFFRWFCLFEVAIVSILGFNILEGVVAIRYPRAPLPPLASPARSKLIHKSPAQPQRARSVLSPNSSPQPQKPFSYSQSMSALSASGGKYPASPLSTPSRTIQYTIPPSTPNTSISSLAGAGYLSTPSPIVSAYRGKHPSGSLGRSLDGAYLGRLAVDDSDEDD